MEDSKASLTPFYVFGSEEVFVISKQTKCMVHERAT